MNNYYLKLLYSKAKELKEILEKAEDENPEYIEYLIGGYIVTLSSILEVGIGDLHSENFDDIASLIYYTRQKIVHYGHFNGMKNLEKNATEIIDYIEKNHDKEQEYFTKLVSNNEDINKNNVMIKYNQNIVKDSPLYKFKSLDETQVLCVPSNKLFFLTKKNSEKVTHFIVDTSTPCALYTYRQNDVESFKELKGDALKKFFKDNYQVQAENYSEHIIVMQNIINSFIKDPINSIQIMEVISDEQFCRNTIEVIKDYIFNKSMNEAYITSNYLIKDKYSLSKMQKADYSKLLKDFNKNQAKYIDEKDAFFIEETILTTKHFAKLLSDFDIDINFKPEAMSVLLIQLFETGPKHFSNRLISSSPEFKKCYSNLLRYRQIFSHYILSNKEYNDGVTKFKQEFVKFVNFLQTIDLTHVQSPIKGEVFPYVCIERSKKDFFNYKHEQFLKISKDTYIGKKILYSSHNPQSKSLIAILPGGNNIANTTYYEKDSKGNLTPKYEENKKTGKQVHINALSHPLANVKAFEADLSLSYLFKAYFELRKLSNKHTKITINFHACNSNSNYCHKDDLSSVILRYFNQGYIPAELLQNVKIDTNNLSKGYIELLDSEGNIIASIINEKKCNFKYNNYPEDSKDYFSRIDNIAHDFSKRRHSNVK